MSRRHRPRSSTTAAELVRTARTRRHLSQRELAHTAGVPQSTVSHIESGRRQPSVMMLERLLDAAGFRIDATLTNTVRPSILLARHHAEVAAVIARYPVTSAWVFGSVARHDDSPDSDLDLLVELAPGSGFVDYVGLEDDLVALLGCGVDVITTREMEANPLFQRRVSRDLRPLDLAA